MPMTQRVIGSVLLVLTFLAGCTPNEPAPASTPAIERTPTHAPASGPTQAPTDTPDPCDGWWCTVKGVVYVDEIGPGNELKGAEVTLGQFSYCSPTKGKTETITGPDGTFEFEKVFFHDTDRVWLEIGSEEVEDRRWDSKGRYCYFCSCFSDPIEIVLPAQPD